jgi:hypothetical protein
MKTVGVTNLVQASRVVWVIVNLRSESRHDPQVGIVGTNMDVEVLHIVRGALPPRLRVACNIIRVIDDGCFAVLRAHRPIQVEAVEPQTRTIQHLSSMVFVLGLSSVWVVQIQVSCHADHSVSTLYNSEAMTAYRIASPR